MNRMEGKSKSNQFSAGKLFQIPRQTNRSPVDVGFLKFFSLHVMPDKLKDEVRTLWGPYHLYTEGSSLMTLAVCLVSLAAD